MMIPITKPCLGPEEAEATATVVAGGWVAQGPCVARFERVVADYCGTAEAVAVSSGTAALHLSLLVLGVGPGDEVICPSMSFIATANAIRHAGAVAVFADVDRRTVNLDPAAVEAAITPRTKAILVVHQIGLPAELDRFLALGEKHGVKIFEDAACALGSRWRNRPIGGHTEMACFSFHPRKVITTGEGGMVTTDNAEYARRLRLLRNHGLSVSEPAPGGDRQPVRRYECLGYNYRMTDIQAAIGLEQMKKLDWICRRRREVAGRYRESLAGHPWLSAPWAPGGAEPNYQSFAVQLADNAPLSRDALLQALWDAGVAAQPGCPSRGGPRTTRC
jgi:dTDP-4-amino-4,6-dideoxygalactose transaminase